METVYNYLYNYFTKYNLLVPNIPLNQVNNSMFIACIQSLKFGEEVPTIQVYTHNKVDFIAGGIHQYLACLKLNKPFHIKRVDNIGFGGATLPLMFYNEWYRTITNIRAQHAQT